MSKGERVGASLIVCAIGVSLIPVYAVVGVPLALLAAGVAIYEAQRSEPPNLSDDQIARKDASRRLRAIAQSAIDLAVGSTDDGNFRTRFFQRWSATEFISLYGHLESRFGIAVRDNWLTIGPHLGPRLDLYVAAMQETANRLDGVQNP